MSEVVIRPNSKSRHRDIEISCYGEELIMVDHPIMPAPKPVGPKKDDFWGKSDEERLEDILDYLDAKIDWAESDPGVLLSLGKDISKVREEL